MIRIVPSEKKSSKHSGSDATKTVRESSIGCVTSDTNFHVQLDTCALAVTVYILANYGVIHAIWASDLQFTAST